MANLTICLTKFVLTLNAIYSLREICGGGSDLMLSINQGKPGNVNMISVVANFARGLIVNRGVFCGCNHYHHIQSGY